MLGSWLDGSQVIADRIHLHVRAVTRMNCVSAMRWHCDITAAGCSYTPALAARRGRGSSSDRVTETSEVRPGGRCRRSLTTGAMALLDPLDSGGMQLVLQQHSTADRTDCRATWNSLQSIRLLPVWASGLPLWSSGQNGDVLCFL
jgi:hypothetical protein